jgi:hypothetical protein
MSQSQHDVAADLQVCKPNDDAGCPQDETGIAQQV